MRALVAMSFALALGACASESAEPLGGYANYDALRAAKNACAAKGGVFRLKPEGNPERIDAYACERK